MIIRFYSILFLFASLGVHSQENISIIDAWIASAPPGVNVQAGYLTIINQGQDQRNLVSISSPVFSKIEIHKTVMNNDIMRMEMFENLLIAADEQLELKPGDFHLMLYNANRQLNTENTVPLLFEFSDNTKIEITARVRNMTDQFQQVPDNQTASTTSDPYAGLKVSYQHLLPQHFLSRLMYKLTRSTWEPFKNIIIRRFIKSFHVDMSLAVEPDPANYDSFNAFFTRQLKSDARPIASSSESITSPVDGSISQFGHIQADKLVQAKGKEFTLLSLLGNDQSLAAKYMDGDFITLYLSPRDYHRIHMPIKGDLESMMYVPGKLFSVSPTTTQGVDNLFARNERVINIFNTEIGSMALIMVGAIFVGSMETVWAGEITPSGIGDNPTGYHVTRDELIRLHKGEEMGRFNMGSTVILLFEKGKLNWKEGIRVDSGIKMGQIIAEIRNTQVTP